MLRARCSMHNLRSRSSEISFLLLLVTDQDQVEENGGPRTPTTTWHSSKLTKVSSVFFRNIQKSIIWRAIHFLYYLNLVSNVWWKQWKQEKTMTFFWADSSHKEVTIFSQKWWIFVFNFFKKWTMYYWNKIQILLFFLAIWVEPLGNICLFL